MILDSFAVENCNVGHFLFPQGAYSLNFAPKELAYEIFAHGEGNLIKDRNHQKSKSPDAQRY